MVMALAPSVGAPRLAPGRASRSAVPTRAPGRPAAPRLRVSPVPTRCAAATGGLRAARAPRVSQRASVRAQALCARTAIAERRALAAGGRPFLSVCARKHRDGRLVIAAALAGSETEEGRDLEEARALLERQLPSNPDLVRGQLDNGLQYVILPNKAPPGRFEAHLEVHSGSVDEAEHEQGVAHIVEHVTFLGSRKREILLGTGARSNAYTDFHHTVFHVHAPLTNANNGSPMLPQVLDALVEIAFEPEFSPARIAKERKAVLAEAQMMNTIEYRVDCQLLKYLHEENALGCRFPIGKVDQIKKWDRDVLTSFWSKWYFPANATLYLVGDIPDGAKAAENLIAETFGRVPAARLPVDVEAQPVEALAAEVPTNGSENGNGSTEMLGPAKKRHEVRPPVVHGFGCGPIAADDPTNGTTDISVFRHPLLQQFMLNIFCKLPVSKLETLDDLKDQFLTRILISVFQFRINSVYATAGASFQAIELDISDSGREGCCVCTLSITSEPGDWKGAVQVAIQEARRLQKFGVTPGEMSQYVEALLRDSAQVAKQADCTPSRNNLDFVMECLALEQTFMDPAVGHSLVEDIVSTIRLEEVNARAKSFLAFASHYGRERGAQAEAEQGTEGEYAPIGATRATSVVACIPEFCDASGRSVGGGAPVARGSAMSTMGHVDASGLDIDDVEEDDLRGAADVPEGAMRFDLDADDIAECLQDDSLEIAAREDIDVPSRLMPDEDVEAKIAQYAPAYVPLRDGLPAEPHKDIATGITQARLSNGVTLNTKQTDNEPGSVLLRVCAAGGRALESSEAGPDGAGSIVVGVRGMSDSGTVGKWEREQLELFCISQLINCNMDTDYENVVIDIHTMSSGLRGAMELLHLLIEEPCWDADALARAKAAFMSAHQSLPKSLERATTDRILSSMCGEDRRFRDPSPAEIEALTLDGCRKNVSSILTAANLEVSVVGDFDPEELHTLMLRYFGTLTPSPEADTRFDPAPLELRSPPQELVNQVWHLRDSDERACAQIAGRLPARWGQFGRPETIAPIVGPIQPPPVLPLNASPEERAMATQLRRAHPVYSSVVLMLLQEIINSRLFTTVRDQLGLTYDVSFEMTTFDRLRVSWYAIEVTSTPQKIHDALSASIDVLRTVGMQRISERELLRAKRTVLTRHETDLKDNNYHLALLTHLMSDSVPLKTTECLRDLEALYRAVTVDDVLDAYKHFALDEANVFTCIGTSGSVAPNIPAAPARRGGSPQALGDAGAAGQQWLPEDPAQFFAALMTAANAMKLMNNDDPNAPPGSQPPPGPPPSN